MRISDCAYSEYVCECDKYRDTIRVFAISIRPFFTANRTSIDIFSIEVSLPNKSQYVIS